MKGAGMDESAIERLLGRDLSEGTEAFRDALLYRCLEVLGQADEGIPLDDDALDLLSAAGELGACVTPPALADDDK